MRINLSNKRHKLVKNPIKSHRARRMVLTYGWIYNIKD